jgi:hypothetical protein
MHGQHTLSSEKAFQAETYNIGLAAATASVASH